MRLTSHRISCQLAAQQYIAPPVAAETPGARQTCTSSSVSCQPGAVAGLFLQDCLASCDEQGRSCTRAVQKMGVGGSARTTPSGPLRLDAASALRCPPSRTPLPPCSPRSALAKRRRPLSPAASACPVQSPEARGQHISSAQRVVHRRGRTPPALAPAIAIATRPRSYLIDRLHEPSAMHLSVALALPVLARYSAHECPLMPAPEKALRALCAPGA